MSHRPPGPARSGPSSGPGPASPWAQAARGLPGSSESELQLAVLRAFRLRLVDFKKSAESVRPYFTYRPAQNHQNPVSSTWEMLRPVGDVVFAAGTRRIDSALQDELDLDLVQKFTFEWKRDHRHMGSEWDELKDARTENYDYRIHLSIWTGDAEFEKTFNSKPDGEEGRYILQYFQFLKFIIFSNFVMTIWSFIGWIPHVQNARPLMDREGLGALTDSSSAVDLLFLSSYQPSSDKYWQAMVVLGTLWMICTGPMYMLACRFFEKQDPTNHDSEIHKKEISDIIHPDIPPPRKHRIFATYVVLMVICLIPIGINYALLYELNRKNLKVSDWPFQKPMPPFFLHWPAPAPPCR